LSEQRQAVFLFEKIELAAGVAVLAAQGGFHLG